jgi:hypothetical protein
MNVLKFVGFSGDRKEAVKNLKMAASLQNGLRYKIVSLVTIFYNLYMEQFYGLGKGDLEWTEELVDDLASKYPKVCTTQ